MLFEFTNIALLRRFFVIHNSTTAPPSDFLMIVDRSEFLLCSIHKFISKVRKNKVKYFEQSCHGLETFISFAWWITIKNQSELRTGLLQDLFVYFYVANMPFVRLLYKLVATSGFFA